MSDEVGPMQRSGVLGKYLTADQLKANADLIGELREHLQVEHGCDGPDDKGGHWVRAALLDSPKPDGRREPGTYRTPEGGIEVVVGIEESASFVEDQFPAEIEYIVAARLRERGA